MSIRLRSRSLGTIIGGELSVDISHLDDSVSIGDGTNTLILDDVGGTKTIPVTVLEMPASAGGATEANQTNGTQKTQINNGADVVEIDDVGGEKALKVSVIASVGGGGGGTAATDSAAYTATSSQFTPVGGAYDDASSDALSEGEMGMVRMTSARAMHVAQQGTVTVTGTVTVDTSALATHAKQDTANNHLSDISGDTGSMSATLGLTLGTVADVTPGFATMAGGTDGTNARILKTDTNGELQIDVLSSALPTGAATLGEQQTQTTALSAIQTAVQTLDNAISGSEMQVDIVAALPAGTNNIGDVDVLSLPSIPAGTNNIGDVDVLTLPGVAGTAAHDAGVSGNPVRIGGRAMLANGTAVAEDDTADIATDNQGRIINTPHVPRDLVLQGTTTYTNTTEGTVLSAAASTFHDLTKLIITNSSSTAVRVDIRDDSAGTVRLSVALAANGGAVIDFGAVPMTQTAVNKNWTAQLSASVSSVYVFMQAIKRIA